MLLSKRAKNLLEKMKERSERKRERERDRKIYRPIFSLSIDVVVKNFSKFYLQSMGFAEAGLERL